MRTALFILALLIAPRSALLSGPFFFGQQGAVATRSTSAFNPATYGAVALWGAARYETGYANNDAVGGVSDFSGNSRTATQSTAAAKPTFKAAGQVAGVSLPVLYCDGGDRLNTASFSAVASPYTIAFVAKSATTAASNAAFGSNDPSNYIGVAARPSGKWLAYANGGIDLEGGTTTTWSVVVAVFDGASSFMYVNGAKTTGSPGTGTFSNGASIGAWRTTYEPFNGHIGEWVLWSEALTDSEASAACSALRTAWGL